jgi:hypothetical protein
MADEPQSIREMAEQDTPESELFPLGSLEGDDTTLGQIIKPSHTVEITVSMGTAEVPSPSGGLLNPNDEGLLLVTYEHAGYTPVPVRKGDRVAGKEITGWKIRQNLRPIHVERVHGEAGAIEAAFVDLLRENDEAAGALLDRMKRRAEQALGVPA